MVGNHRALRVELIVTIVAVFTKTDRGSSMISAKTAYGYIRNTFVGHSCTGIYQLKSNKKSSFLHIIRSREHGRNHS